MSDQVTDRPVDASTPPAAAAKARPEPSRNKASFKAAHLHALEPIIRASQNDDRCWNVAGLFVEPVEAGGVILTATNGSVLASIFDPDGGATARVRLTIPDVVFERATPPVGVPMWSEGEAWNEPPPEYMQPGWVYAWGLSCFVLPRMHRPGDDPRGAPMLGHAILEEGNTYRGGYRIRDIDPDVPTFNWRSVLARERVPGDGVITLQPCMVAMFDRIAKLSKGYLQFDIATQFDAIHVSAASFPEFVGAIMPTRSDLTDGNLPAWAVAR